MAAASDSDSLVLQSSGDVCMTENILDDENNILEKEPLFMEMDESDGDSDCENFAEPERDTSKSDDEEEEPMKEDSNEDIELGKLPESDFTPREYQVELFQAALEMNTIICLGTGTGKTYIGVMMIKEYEEEMKKKSYEEGGKRTVFLVPTVPLVEQQKSVVKRHTSLKVKGYIGAMGVDFWKQDAWLEEFKENQVLVMTPDIFKLILHHSFMPLSRVCLLILDECHKAVKNHSYREIARSYSDYLPGNRPKILGLTASVINSKSKITQVSKKINELECALHGRTLTASNEEMTSKYGTKPKEIVVFHDHYELNADLETVLEALTYGQQLKEKDFKRCLKLTHDALVTLGPWCAREAARDCISSLQDDLLADLDHSEILETNKCLDSLNLIVDVLSQYLENQDIKKQLLHKVPPKLMRLLEVLYFFKDFEKKLCGIVFVEQRITAYILNEWLRRVSKEFPEYKFIESEFIVGHASDPNKNLDQARMNTNKQEKILQGFRRQDFNLLIATSVIEEGMDVPECNVVIRFDFPRDFRAYIQSKGRARAERSMYIMLVDVTEQGLIRSTLSDYVNVEKILLKKCHDRIVPDEEVIEKHFADELCPPYKPYEVAGSPQVSLTTAISLVNWYCNKLPSDKFTLLKPSFEIKKTSVGLEPQFVCTVTLPLNSKLKESVTGNSMQTKKLSKMAAALEVCKKLHEIGELDERLLPRKKPELLAGVIDDDDEENVLSGTPKRGTKKRRQRYIKAVAKEFTLKTEEETPAYYLHGFISRLAVPLTEEQNWRKDILFFPERTNSWFGILTTKQFPKVPSFPLYTRSGEERVSVVYLGKTNLTADEIKKLWEFHQILFEDVLSIKTNLLAFDPSNSVMSSIIVPLILEGANGNIDWTLVSKVVNNKIVSTQQEEFVFNESNYLDAVVKPTYRLYGTSDHYQFVEEINCDLHPDSQFPDEKFATFRDYFKIMYQKAIANSEQPLLRVACIPLRLNLLTPKDLTLKGKRQMSKSSSIMKRNITYLVPELCSVHPISATVWRKAVCIPSILYRLNQLLLSESLRKQISTEGGIGISHSRATWPDLNFGWDCSEERLKYSENHLEFGRLLHSNHIEDVHSCSGLKSYEFQPDLTNSYGPNPSVLTQAMTSAKAADGFHLERLEIVGDSFLKFVASVYLFMKDPDAHEGILTQCRSRIVSNKNLYRHAVDKGLCQMIAQEKFEPKFNWLPPGYVVPDGLEEIFEDKVFIQILLKNKLLDFKSITCEQIKTLYQEFNANPHLHDKDLPPIPANMPFRCSVKIPDKTVADSIEAIIGVYLLTCGPLGALRFLKWLGLKILQEVELEWPIQSSLLKFPEHVSTAVDRILHKFANAAAEIESIIGYSFRNRLYLLQAVTHASCSKNVFMECYQRLEFLGDAVIDYLITMYIYDGSKNLTPGELSDVRMALVNNSLFAELIVKYKLNTYLRYSSPDLFRAIDRFIAYLNILTEKENDSTTAAVLKEHFLHETECEEPEEVEVPKALGDLFESIAGAVYLDSNMSLDTVWKMIYKMMEREIEHFKRNVPVHPIRKLYELYPEKVKFSNVEVKPGGKVEIRLTVENKEFVAVGKNKGVVKTALAKKALSRRKT